MPREKFLIELDREEALMMVFLSASSGCELSRVQQAVEGIASALRHGDPSLHAEQARMWLRYDRPTFDLSGGPDVPADEL